MAALSGCLAGQPGRGSTGGGVSEWQRADISPPRLLSRIGCECYWVATTENHAATGENDVDVERGGLPSGPNCRGRQGYVAIEKGDQKGLPSTEHRRPLLLRTSVPPLFLPPSFLFLSP